MRLSTFKILFIAGVAFLGANFDHEQLVVSLQIGINIILAHGELNTSLIKGEFEAFLADSLNSVGTRKLVGFVHFVHFNENIIDDVALGW